MIYFFINLFLHFLVSALLLILLLRLVNNNRRRKNRRGITYLFPVVVSIVFLIQVITASAPRVLDSVYVMKQNYQTVSGRVESVKYLNHALIIDGETYYYNPFFPQPQPGDVYEISYTPYAHYISEFSLAQQPDSGIRPS